MARNSEKRLSELNRFLEAKETEKNAKLQRPSLGRLDSAEEVKGWIPSIEKEISFFLKQVEGTGSRKHNDEKIKEFQERINYLQREHKRFVAKVRSLDPSYMDVVPWQPRGYRRKRGRGEGPSPTKTKTEGEVNGPLVKRLCSPLLEQEERLQVSSEKPYSSSASQECCHIPPEGPQGDATPLPSGPSTTERRGSEGWSECVEGISLSGSTGGLLGLDYSSSSEEEQT